jgi:hypothetical protein
MLRRARRVCACSEVGAVRDIADGWLPSTWPYGELGLLQSGASSNLKRSMRPATTILMFSDVVALRELTR